ncbi:hypothetical protein Aperf_G00000033947 [Anoplocephala perfoliata]
MVEHKNEITKTTRDLALMYQVTNESCKSEEHLMALGENSQLERLGLAARSANKERAEALKLWEKTVNRSEDRTKEIESLLQSFDMLELRMVEKLKEKKIQENYLINSVKDTAECKVKLEDGEKYLQELKGENSTVKSEIADTSSELKALKLVTDQSCLNLRSARLAINNSKSAISLLYGKLNDTVKKTENLNAKLEETLQDKLSVDQVVAETDNLLRKEEEYAVKLAKHIEDLCRARFRLSQEQQSARAGKLGAENLIKHSKNGIKNLDVEVSKADETVTQQERILYGQNLKIIRLENRVSKLEMDTSSAEELEALRDGVEKLSAELEGLESLHRKLLNETKRLQVESMQIERATTKISTEKLALDAQRENEELYIEQSEKALKEHKTERNQILVDKTMLRLKIRKIDEKIEYFNAKYFNLEKFRLDMESYVKARELDINVTMEMLTAKIRLANEEKLHLKKEINNKRNQADKLMNRYEVESLKIENFEDGEMNSQTYHVIKVMQEIDDLRSYGNKLDADIEQAKKEMEALQNTLLLVKESNRIYEHNCVEADPDSIEERDELEQIYKKLRSTIQERKSHYISLANLVKAKKEETKNAEEELMQAATFETELEAKKVKQKKDAELLEERILRASNCLRKAKLAALKELPGTAGVDDGEIGEDIDLKLLKDLVEMVVALLMSKVRVTRVDQKAVEIQARAYLRAADISIGAGSSGAAPSDVSSSRTSIASSSASGFLSSTASSRWVIET